MRTLSAVFGTVLAIGIIASIFGMSGIEAKYFINPLGILVVVGGTMSAVFLSYSFQDVMKVAKISMRIFLRKNKGLKKTAESLLDFTKTCKKNGTPRRVGPELHPFVNDCLVLIHDGYSTKDMEEMLSKRIDTFYENETYEVGLVQSMAKYPPSFGMIGTVVGLIALMSKLGVGDTDMNIGPYLAIALTTTLYGLMISSFIFRPISDNLEIRARHNMKIREMVLEVMLLIKENVSFLVVQDTVNALLPPRSQVVSEETRLNGVEIAA